MSCLAVPQFLVGVLLVPLVLTYCFRNRMNVCLPCGASDATETWEAATETDCRRPDVSSGVTFGHYTYASIAIGHQYESTVPRRIRIPCSPGIRDALGIHDATSFTTPDDQGITALVVVPTRQ